ncbi:MAG: hypothetical protein U5K76_13075 [Woeseiaceae bacterium]|nr:hypothetical protein [Woeseiaceae bacterium]
MDATDASDLADFLARHERVAIVNRGRTRGDNYATLRVDGDCGALLGAAAGTLLGRAPAGAAAGP